MKTIFIATVTYFNEYHQFEYQDKVNRVFINEDDAKGYCKLMNDFPNKDWLYTYDEYNICEKDYKRFA